MKRTSVRSPSKLFYPVQIVRVYVEADARVILGEPLFLIQDFSGQKVSIKAPLSGVVEDVFFNHGDVFQTPEILCRLKVTSANPRTKSRHPLARKRGVTSADTSKPQSTKYSASYQYWAFISYAHEDRKWAKRLKNKLDSFKPSADFLERSRRPPDSAERSIFLDVDDLVKSGDDLVSIIQTKALQSQNLIVICSPNSADPTCHVSAEVQAFIQAGRREDIFPIIVGGEPGRPFTKDDCFPPALRKGRKGESFNPLSPDFRDDPSYKNTKEWANLLSSVLRVERSVIYDANKRQRKRRRRAQFAAALLSAGVGVSVGIGAIGTVLAPQLPLFDQPFVYFNEYNTQANVDFVDFLLEHDGQKVEILTGLDFSVATLEHHVVHYLCNGATGKPNSTAYDPPENPNILDGQIFNRDLRIPYGDANWGGVNDGWDYDSRLAEPCPGEITLNIETDSDQAKSSFGGTGMVTFDLRGVYIVNVRYFATGRTIDLERVDYAPFAFGF